MWCSNSCVFLCTLLLIVFVGEDVDNVPLASRTNPVGLIPMISFDVGMVLIVMMILIRFV